jgi:hypothetical protein
MAASRSALSKKLGILLGIVSWLQRFDCAFAQQTLCCNRTVSAMNTATTQLLRSQLLPTLEPALYLTGWPLMRDPHMGLFCVLLSLACT